MARFKNLILTELGNTTDGYDWRLAQDDPSMRTYVFDTPNYTYEVFVEMLGADMLAIDFGLEKHAFGNKFAVVTDEGNQFKIVATVINIAKHAWETRERFDTDEELKGFMIHAAHKEGSETNKRLKLYSRFIQARFPDARIEREGNSGMIVYPPKQ